MAFFEVGGGTGQTRGRGEASVALARGTDAVWCNASGIASPGGFQVEIGYEQLFVGLSGGGISRGEVGTAFGIGGRSGLAVAISNLSAPASSETVGGIGYGLSMGGLRVGAVAKVLRWAVEGDADPISGVKDKDRSKTSFSLDLGAAYSMGDGRFILGAAAYDVLTPDISESGSDDGKIPLGAQIGLAFRGSRTALELDFSYRSGVPDLRLGAESYLIPLSLAMRTGLTGSLGGENGRGIDHLSLGFGYSYRRFVLDFAYRYDIRMGNLYGSYDISIRYNL